MADIDIVPKRRSRAWVWILLAIVIVVALWLAFGSSRASSRVDATSSGRPLAAVAAPAPILL